MGWAQLRRFRKFASGVHLQVRGGRACNRGTMSTDTDRSASPSSKAAMSSGRTVQGLMIVPFIDEGAPTDCQQHSWKEQYSPAEEFPDLILNIRGNSPDEELGERTTFV